MRTITLAAMLSVILAPTAFASPPLPAPPTPSVPVRAGPPKLLVVIAVDQLSADLFDEYRPQFSAGLGRLAAGTAFRNGYQSHATTETCPGHSTILTGDHPSRTGIVANSWIDQSAGRADKTIYCAEDETAPGSTSSKYVVSAKHLLVPTLGELMKHQWPQSRTVAVAGKDRAAVMMSGPAADQRWYWTGAGFDTDLPSVPIPAVVPKVNAAAAAGLAQSRPALDPTPFCAAKAKVYKLAGGKTIGAGRLARAGGDQEGFRASTELDGDTLALAVGLVDEMQLGRRNAPDLLAIGLSATDYVGHSYGTEGQEMCLHLTELDRELGDFFQVLDDRGIDYSVALTADHGGQDIPERDKDRGLASARRVAPGLYPKNVGTGLLGEGPGGDIYVDRSLPPAVRARTLASAVQSYRSRPDVEAVFTAAEIGATPMPEGRPDQWSLIQRARAGYHPGRSGDLYVILKKDVSPIAVPSGAVATHGSAWDYDRRVPIVFWRQGMPAVPLDRPIDAVDTMPTLAAEIGLPLGPGSIDGKCLPEVTACPAP